MTEQELDEMQKLCDAATEGPWNRVQFVKADDEHAQKFRIRQIQKTPLGSMSEEDAAFIAAARTAMPALIAEIRRLQQVIIGATLHSNPQSMGEALLGAFDEDEMMRLTQRYLTGDSKS